MAKTKNSRLVAADIIANWMEDQRFPDRALAKVESDHAFVLEVVNGVIRNQSVFHWLERKWLKNPPANFFRAVLHVGLYQLLLMDNVEEYAAINETVAAAKGRPGGPGNAKMINAVLRRAQREGDAVFQSLEKQPAYVRLSHPKFLMDRWTKTYGSDGAIKLAEWDNNPPLTFMRVEQFAVEASDFLTTLSEAGIETQQHPFSESEIFLSLPRGKAVWKIPGYEEGFFTIQDPATSLSVDLLAPRPGETVLDACAAPGGKMAMIAGRMKGQGELVAMDLHVDRIDVLKDNQKRLNLDWVELIQGDARMPQKALGSRKFDAILLDVPCLNTGVLRRRADARWRVDEDRLGTITKLQREILNAAADLLTEKGRIVYSTCSLEPEENEELIARWLSEHSSFELVESKKAFPPESNTDGAFAALLQRK